MLRTIRPLWSAATYSGALFALTGALIGIVAMPFALIPLAVWRLPSPILRTLLFSLTLAGLIAWAGTLRGTRSASVSLANRLLGAELPSPGATPLARRSHRVRTSAWLLLHGGVGGLTTLAVALLLMAAVTLPAVWIGGGDKLTWFGLPATVGAGWHGAWTLPVSLGCLVLAAAVCAAGAALLRPIAGRLLGHTTAERLAVLEERQAVLARRNRLAQELHDSIGHTLTAATIQAAVATELLEADPAAAREALRSIEESSRAALDDLDYVLGALREEQASTAPARTLADLPALLDRIRTTGAEVRAEVTGDLAQVTATVSREAYRILQEGLTNALRHGERHPVMVRLAVDPTGLEIEVVNQVAAVTRPIGRRADWSAGRSAARPLREGQGRGLTGLAERVRLLNGEISAGRTSEAAHQAAHHGALPASAITVAPLAGRPEPAPATGDGHETGGRPATSDGHETGGRPATSDGHETWRLAVRIPVRSPL